jgi:hypothetical protein
VDRILLELLAGRMPESLEETDPDQLLEQCRRHRILPYIPPAFLERNELTNRKEWRLAHQANTLHSLRLAAVLGELTETMQSNFLDFIAIKGPVLARQLYDDVGRRHFRDLDILVRPEAFHRILEVLEKTGYHLAYPRPGLTREQWAYYFRYKKDVDLVHREHDVVLELHLGLFRSELLTQAEENLAWEGAGTHALGGKNIRVLSAETALLYLLYHGGQHMYFRLLWLKDVSTALSTWELDHALVLEMARKVGVERLVFLGLLLCEEFFRQEIPEVYLKGIRQHRNGLQRMRKICLARFSAPERETFRMKFGRYRFLMLQHPGFRHWLRIPKNLWHRRLIRRQFGGL